ncbi:MAG: hypothetical protein ABIR19_09685 [Ginsengibacter sp.]
MRLIACLPMLFLYTLCHGQSSDIIVLKKNYKAIRTFFPGNEVDVSSSTNYYHGFITSINRDSIFLVQYDVKQRPTSLGVYFLDTVGTYRRAVFYRDITGLYNTDGKKFNWAGSGGALFGGGILLTTVGMGTWLFAKPNTRYHASPYLVGSSAVLGGIGYLLLRSGMKGIQIGRKYSLEYIQVK